MTNPAQQTHDVKATARTLKLILVVNGQPYEADVQSQEIFHEALEHALPGGLLSGHDYLSGRYRVRFEGKED
jgi:hypothetical protein